MSYKGVFLVVVVFLLASLAQAQNRVELFAGYSFLHGAVNTPLSIFPEDMHLNGWNASAAGRLVPHVQALADFGGYYASPTVVLSCAVQGVPFHCPGPLHTHIYNVLFGPQVSASMGKLTPFAHALFGVAHITVSPGNSPSFSDTRFADAIGGGGDYWLTHRVGLRVQADYFQNRLFSGGVESTPAQNNLRFSTGIVFRP